MKRKKTSKPRSRNAAALSFPSSERWEELVRNLKLSKEQEKCLASVLRNALVDIETAGEIQKRIPDRGDLKMRLKKFETYLKSLRNEVERSSHVLVNIFPLETLESLGSLFTFSTIGEAIHKEVFPASFNIDLEHLRIKNESFGLEAIEKLYEGERSDYGLTHTAPLLLHVINLLLAPLQKFLELDKLNKGGSPPNATRRFLVERLAAAAPIIIGRRAPVSVTGAFVSLCEQVLPACGLPASGIDKAIPAIARKINRERPALPNSKDGSRERDDHNA
jgi:hypothetical protein